MLLLMVAPPRLDAADHGGGVAHSVPDLREQQAGGRRQGAGALLLGRAARAVARAERLQPAVPGALRRVGRQGAAGRFRQFDPLQDAGQRPALGPARQYRHPGLVRVRDHDPALAGARRAVGDARGLGAGSKYLVRLDPHHLGAGVRLGDLPRGAVRVQARLAARHLGDDRRLQPGRAGPAGGGAGPLRLRLRRADDPRLDGRGDDLAIHPHRRAQGPAADDGDHAPRAAQRADRAVHGHRAAAQLAACPA